MAHQVTGSGTQYVNLHAHVWPTLIFSTWPATRAFAAAKAQLGRPASLLHPRLFNYGKIQLLSQLATGMLALGQLTSQQTRRWPVLCLLLARSHLLGSSPEEVWLLPMWCLEAVLLLVLPAAHLLPGSFYFLSPLFTTAHRLLPSKTRQSLERLRASFCSNVPIILQVWGSLGAEVTGLWRRKNVRYIHGRTDQTKSVCDQSERVK